jgi:hypothetical protein
MACQIADSRRLFWQALITPVGQASLDLDVVDRS